MAKTVPRIYRLARGQAAAKAERRSLGGNALGGATFGTSALLPAPVLSGVAVTPETALTFTACFACIQALATDLAGLTRSVRRTRPGQGSRVVTADPRHTLVFCTPRENVTAYRFFQALWGHRFGWGNGYAEIVRRNGMPVALHLHSPRPTDTWPEYSRNKTLWYQLDGGRRQARAEDVLHFAGLSFGGLTGYSPIALARQAVGYGLAVEQFGAAFYGNAAVPRGALKVQKRLTPEGMKNLRESVAAVHSDTVNAHRLMILEEGTEFQPFSIPPQDAEYVATRQFQAVEMCRIFRVPPPRIQDFTGTSSVYKALSDMLDDYISSTLGPETTMAEQELDAKFFTTRERAHGLGVRHDFRALTKGNLLARAQYYEKRFSMGSMSPDEIREAEGDNPRPGSAGNRFYLGSSFQTLDDDGNVAASASAPGPDDGDGPDAEDDADQLDDQAGEGRSERRFNPNHDAHSGKFSSGVGGGGGPGGGGAHADPNAGLPDGATTAEGRPVRSGVEGVGRYAEVQGPDVLGARIPDLSDADRARAEARVLRAAAPGKRARERGRWSDRDETDVTEAAMPGGALGYASHADGLVRGGDLDGLRDQLHARGGEGRRFARGLAQAREVYAAADRLVADGRLVRVLGRDGAGQASTGLRWPLPSETTQ